MKKNLSLTILIMILITISQINARSYAETLTFDKSDKHKYEQSIHMYENSDGGAHLYMEFYDDDDRVVLDKSTTVNSFSMNAMPHEGYVVGISPDDWVVKVEAFDANDNSVWSTTIDLADYQSWDNWYTVNVNAKNVSYLIFRATGGWDNEQNLWNKGFWPSIDNLTINEPIKNDNLLVQGE